MLLHSKRLAAGGLLLLALVAVVSTAFAGELHIEVVSKGFQHDFWKEVNRGCTEAGKEFNATVNFVGPASETETDEQIALLARALENKPDAICIAALSPEKALVDLVFQASENGIPVITFDSDIGSVAGDDVRAFVATDNRDAGAHAAQQMYEVLNQAFQVRNGPVRIGVLSQDTISQSIGDRTFGFIEELVHLFGPENTSVEGALLYRNIVPQAKIILDVGIPPTVADDAMEIVARALLAKPDLVGAYASNEFAAKNMVKVNEEINVLGPHKAIGIGFDSGLVQVEAVRQRVLYGSVTQNPYMIGYLTVKTAIEAASGRQVTDQTVPFYFYTAGNMDEPAIASCLYE